MARLIDYFIDWRGNGLFKNLGNWTPWHNSAHVTKSALDWQYFGNRSGYKTASPYLTKILPPFRVLTVEQMRDIDIMLETLYKDSWQKLWDAFQLNYTIGENVNVDETIHEAGTKNVDTTDGGSAATDINSNMKNYNKVVPFGGNGNAVELTEQETDGNTNSSASKNSYDRSGSNDTTVDMWKTRNRKGKDGGKSYTAEVESEIALRIRKYFDIIFADVDDVLAINYWG